MKYDESVAWLDGFQQFGMKLGLDRMQILLMHLNHPENELKCIHVAGTNGKGSVCRYLLSILHNAGYTVGMYTSPHLETIRERFIINQNLITKKEFTQLIGTIKDVIDTPALQDLNPTYFEICTALAFLYFKEKAVDYALIEVGLGGRFDATNVIMPLASIITNISLDHQHVLGDTIEEIAGEKAGIIKSNIPVITMAAQPALDIISSVAKKNHAPIFLVKDDDTTVLQRDLNGQIILFKGELKSYHLETKEIGLYQEKNLACVMKTIEVLQMQGLYIPDESIEQGVQSMVHPGRMKIIHKNPFIICDGAHNQAGISLLKKSIQALFPEKKVILIFGALSDKNVKEMLKELHSIAKSIIITQAQINRAMNAEAIKNLLPKKYNEQQVTMTQTIKEAISKGLQQAKPTDIILITGSLYTIGEAIMYFKKKKRR